MGVLVLRTSLAGGGGGGDGFSTFTPGTPYGFFDWDISVGRTDSDATKQAAFTGHGTMTGGATGVTGIKDIAQTGTGSGSAGGYLWTGSASDINTAYGHNPGALPGGVSKVLVVEARPQSLGSDTGDPNWKQTDFYVQFGTWKPTIAWRYWQYYLPACTALPIGSTKESNDKLWYPANAAAGTPHGHYLIIDGWRSEEHGNPIRTSGDRNTFAYGNNPPTTRSANNFFASFYSAGMDGNDVNSRLTDSNSLANQRALHTGSGTAANDSSTLEKDMQNGVWYEHTWFVDHSGAQGKVMHWMREKGETSQTLVAEFEGGVTAGFDWPIPAAGYSHGGNTYNLRTDNQICKMPTTCNWFGTRDSVDTSALGDHIWLMGPLQFADSVAQLGNFS